MSASSVGPRPSISTGVTVLAITAGLTLVQGVRAARGHRIDWFFWTGLLMVGCSGLSRFPMGARSRLLVRALSLAAAAATLTGVILAALHDRAH
jgi:hypothetical protein